MKNFKLDNEPKITSGFTIPEGYFNSLDEKINSKLQHNEPKVISIFSKQKTWLYAVAACLLVVFSIPVYQYFEEQKNIQNEQEFEEYIVTNYAITEDDLVEGLHSEEIKNIKSNYNIEDKTIEEALINDENLEDYLTY